MVNPGKEITPLFFVGVVLALRGLCLCTQASHPLSTGRFPVGSMSPVLTRSFLLREYYSRKSLQLWICGDGVNDEESEEILRGV